MPNCVITYIDLAGTKVDAQTGEASKRMQQLHRVVAEAVSGDGLRSISHAYTWNDSVIAISRLHNVAGSMIDVLRDLEALKARIDSVSRNYAVCVKGLAFPRFRASRGKRVTVLETSSWAMANCFVIEGALKKHRASWYIDGRIIKRIPGLQPTGRERVQMHPKSKARWIYLFQHRLDLQRSNSNWSRRRVGSSRAAAQL
jgi:hypothetical protein